MLHTKPYLYDSAPTLTLLDDWISDYFGENTPVYSPIQLQGNSIVLKSLVEQGFGWAIIPYTHLTEKKIFFGNRYTESCRDFDTYLAYIDHLRNYFKNYK